MAVKLKKRLASRNKIYDKKLVKLMQLGKLLNFQRIDQVYRAENIYFDFDDNFNDAPSCYR